MRYLDIFESADDEVALHQQVHDAYRRVTDYIALRRPHYTIELSGYGDFFVYLTRNIGLSADMLLMFGLRLPNTLGMSGRIMDFGQLIFDCQRGLIIQGMREFTEKDMRSTVNSTEFIGVFEHEYLHVLDDMRTNGKIDTGRPSDAENREQYFNSPAEFNAYFHDIAKPMLDALIAIAKEPEHADDILDLYQITGDFNKDVRRMMTATPLIRRFVIWLTPARRKALMKRLYRLYQQALTVRQDHRPSAR